MNRNAELLDIVTLKDAMVPWVKGEWVVIEKLPMILIRDRKRIRYEEYVLFSLSVHSHFRARKGQIRAKVRVMDLEEALVHFHSSVRQAALSLTNKEVV